MSKESQRDKTLDRRVIAEGVRRKEVDLDQLALVYYLLARRRVEAQHRRPLSVDAAGEDAA